MRLRRLILATMISAAVSLPFSASAEQITVFAAASLKEALEEVANGFAGRSDHTVSLSLAGSSVLARQILQGAPADIFISANPEWMDVLEAEAAILPGTRRGLLGNALVLISHEPTAEPTEITSATDLDALVGDGQLAMALVDAVPAGIYGKSVLQNLGHWESLSNRVVQVDNVRAALALVALGEAEFGVVYATDALASPDVNVFGKFPSNAHPPVVYPAALVKDGEASNAFLSYLDGPEATAVFERWGFSVLGN